MPRTMPSQPNAQYPSTSLVVGGSRGIGAATVLRLAARGTRCAIGYVHNDEAARRTAAAAAAIGPEPVLVKGDVALQAPAMVAAARDALGSVDSLVFTAFPALTGRALETTHEQYRRAFDVHYWGTLDAVRAAVDDLAAAKGSVAVVTALGSIRYARYYGILGPAKAALETLVMYLAAELGPRGVRVNGVSPQLIVDEEPREAGVGLAGEEPVHEEAAGMEAIYAAVSKRTPLRRLASSDEIAAVVSNLLSTDFGYVTGQMVLVDGGYALMG